VTTPDLHLDIGGARLKNPVMTASGTFGYGREFADFFDPARLGAVVVKGLTLKPRAGNPPPRIVETPSGMLNAIGMENVGLEVFRRDKLPWLVERGVTVAVNILGETIEEYAALAEGLSAEPGVALIEVNVSCPNVAAGGMYFGADPQATNDVTRAVVRAARQPVMVKLTPLVTDIVTIAQAAVQAGASALSLINTLPAMAVDIEKKRPVLANTIGGLSGPAIRPVALRLVWQVARAVNVPVVGIGGILTVRDALEFLLVGARAVQIGTASFVDPMAAIKILEGIEEYFAAHDIPNLDAFVGKLETNS